MVPEAFTCCWTDHRDNMLYVGYHKGQQDDGYICSSKWMLEEYKQRPENFTRMILAEGTAEDCHVLEVTILKTADAMHSDRFYNQNIGKPYHTCVDESIKQQTLQLRIKEHLSCKEIANQLNLNQSSVSRWIREANLPPLTIRKDGRKYVWHANKRST